MNLFAEIDNQLKKQLISPRVLLDRLRLLDDTSRKSPQYQDPFNLPFYYNLGKFIKAKSVVQVGLDLGLEFCCYLTSNNQVESFLGFQNKSEGYYSNRMAISNIKDINNKVNINYYYGSIYDKFIHDIENFDLLIVNEKNNFDYIKDAIYFFWEKLNEKGHILVNYNSEDKIKNIFVDFCKVKNREPYFFNTRNRIGILEK